MWALARGPTPQSVVTASADGNAKLWTLTADAAQPAQVKHDAAVTVVAASPDGATVLSGTMPQGAVGLAQRLALIRVRCLLWTSSCFSVDGRRYEAVGP